MHSLHHATFQSAVKTTVDAIVATLNDAGEFPAHTDVFVSPSTLHVLTARDALRKDVIVGTQNVSHLKGVGAFTGEHTPEMLLDSGVSWTLVGHSERRNIMGESPKLCGDKTARALESGMSVVFCAGEHLEDREAGRTMDVLVQQLEPLVAAAGAVADAWKRVVIAYEPVWAIGTGKTATPAQAQETHAQLRAWLASTVSPEVAASVRIIYGGSVKGANCAELIALPDIDGFLVGGASLKPEFKDIIACTSAL